MDGSCLFDFFLFHFSRRHNSDNLAAVVSQVAVAISGRGAQDDTLTILGLYKCTPAPRQTGILLCQLHHRCSGRWVIRKEAQIRSELISPALLGTFKTDWKRDWLAGWLVDGQKERGGGERDANPANPHFDRQLPDPVIISSQRARPLTLSVS